MGATREGAAEIRLLGSFWERISSSHEFPIFRCKWDDHLKSERGQSKIR